MRCLITAGPTQEPIDQVRYISNYSSGKMGYALARVARRLGHQVTLISGPVNLSPPVSIRFKKVETAQEMRQAVRNYFPKVDCLIMAAGVSDYRPAHFKKGKLPSQRRTYKLKLVQNPDILKEIGAKRRNKVLVGFALEAKDPIKRARVKLRNKHLDYIVVNSLATMGSNRISASILTFQGIVQQVHQVSKEQLAKLIIRIVNGHFRSCHSRIYSRRH